MTDSRKTKLIIVCIILFILWGVLGVIFNACFFHKDAQVIVTGHYESMVYITPTGDCYHSIECSYITKISPIGLEQATKLGYRACLHCKGEVCGTIWVDDIKSNPKNNYPLSFIISSILIGLAGVCVFVKLRQ